MWDKKQKPILNGFFDTDLQLCQLNLEPKVPADLMKISVKEAMHMGFYYMTEWRFMSVGESYLGERRCSWCPRANCQPALRGVRRTIGCHCQQPGMVSGSSWNWPGSHWLLDPALGSIPPQESQQHHSSSCSYSVTMKAIAHRGLHKCPTFWRRHILFYFVEWQFWYSDYSNFIEVFFLNAWGAL